MALLHAASKTVVVRIVYAGPPLSGKTASVKSLAKMLLGERMEEALYSPGETNGRTLYFDWVDYVGGAFQGYKVNCQIISVPGRQVLSERRRILLQEADAVVFVMDSTAAGMQEAEPYFQELLPWITPENNKMPPVSIVIQANKRDLPEALPLAEIKNQRFASTEAKVVETTANRGIGVREAFVTSVGLALARVARLMDTQQLTQGEPEISSGVELQAQIDALEKMNSLSDEPEAELLLEQKFADKYKKTDAIRPALIQTDLSVSSPAQPVSAIPALPKANPPAGTVWPPIEGRIMLNKIHELDISQLQTQKRNDHWICTIGDWRLDSHQTEVFVELKKALHFLLSYARCYKIVESVLSPQRCLVLAMNEQQSWQLWQIAYHEKTLAEMLQTNLSQATTPFQIATQLIEASSLLIQASTDFARYKMVLPVSLNTISKINGKLAYTGTLAMNNQSEEKTTGSHARSNRDFIYQQFRTVIDDLLKQSNINVPAILNGLKRQQNDAKADASTVEALSALLIGQ